MIWERRVLDPGPVEALSLHKNKRLDPLSGGGDALDDCDELSVPICVEFGALLRWHGEIGGTRESVSIDFSSVRRPSWLRKEE